MNRIARAAALGLFTVLALSGCIRYNIDVTFDSDNTASGTVVTAIQEGIGEQMGADSDQAALDELFAESPFAAEGEKFSVEDYAEDDFIGKKYSFNDLELEQFNTVFGEQFTVTRADDEFILSSDHSARERGRTRSGSAGRRVEAVDHLPWRDHRYQRNRRRQDRHVGSLQSD